ncbi:MAG: hypothetical protein SFZ03_05125 [Candidatus Melainabacteria bacterium]|nr:hypothetical protein [Candidatus Melainabacteria bacterium]
MTTISLQTSVDAALAEISRQALTRLPIDAETEAPLVVSRHSLEMLSRMGLGHLPVDAIATPAGFEGVELDSRQGSYLQLKASLNVKNHLTAFYPARFVAALIELQSLFRRAGLNAYLIGGITRDILLIENRLIQVEDIDITVEGDAIACGQQVEAQSKNFKLTQAFPEFGTAKLVYKDSLVFDLASTRKEVYAECGSLPEVVERGVPLMEDIVRRDFTINALALSVHNLGEVLDYSNGIRDVEQGWVRILHPASFFEDPSRILRALKFAIRLDFQLSPATRRLAEKFVEYADLAQYRGGGSRIREGLLELFRLPDEPLKQQWLDYALTALGSLRLAAFPTFAEITQHHIQVESHYVMERFSALQERCLQAAGLSEPEVEALRWQSMLCVLLAHVPAAERLTVETRLELTRQEREAVEKYIVLKPQSPLRALSPDASNVALYEAFHPLPMATACTLVLLDPAFDSLCAQWQHYCVKLKMMHPSLTGYDLLGLGVPEGEAVGRMLRELLYAKLRGELHDRYDEVQWVRRVLVVPPTPTPPSAL